MGRCERLSGNEHMDGVLRDLIVRDTERVILVVGTKTCMNYVILILGMLSIAASAHAQRSYRRRVDKSNLQHNALHLRHRFREDIESLTF